jgi:isopentenyldiphosphate isomerase
VPPSDPSELLTRVTDDDATVLGPVERRLVHGNPSLIHRSAHLLVLHPEDGTLLLQRRSALKDTFPGRWDTSVGGHVSFGQSYEEAVLREAREEIGVDLAPDSLERLHLLRFRGAEESENTTTFLCRHAGPFVPDPDEISELRFWTRAQIEAVLGTGTFTPHFEQEFAAFLASPRAELLKG